MAGALIGALRVTLGLDSASFSKGLKSSQGKLAGFGKAVGKGLIGVGVAAGAAAVALGGAVKNQMALADEMAKASQKFGIPIDDLSRLKHAA